MNFQTVEAEQKYMDHVFETSPSTDIPEWYPKYFHCTVPHSGTRFVNEAFKKQGFGIAQFHSHKKVEKWTDMVFCHIGPGWVKYLEDCIENSENSWMTVRSPIGTWGTQWKGAHKTFHTTDYFWKKKLGQLRGQYETQMKLAPSLDYIHRVDLDPMSKLGKFVGLDLDENNNMFSTPTPMKAAIASRDVDKIAYLCKGTDFWECFRDSITPDIAEFYKDLGYDIWWNNG